MPLPQHNVFLNGPPSLPLTRHEARRHCRSCSPNRLAQRSHKSFMLVTARPFAHDIEHAGDFTLKLRLHIQP